MVSFDMKSLLTSIPVDLALTITKERLQRDQNLAELTSDSVYNILRLSEFVLNHNYFKYDGDHYKQIFGCAMGSPISPVLADLVMEEIEETAISTFPYPPKWWFRYVDDSHSCIKKDQVDNFHKHLDSINPNTQFTLELENTNGQGLPLIDTITSRRDTKIQMDVYRKPTHTDRYLDFFSCHPMCHKRSFVNTLLENNIPSTNKVVMDCSEHEASLLLESIYTVNIKPVQFHWLFLRVEEQSTEKVEYLPINMFGLRSKFDRRYWVQDALLLLNCSLYPNNYQNKSGNPGSVSPKVTDQFELFRSFGKDEQEPKLNDISKLCETGNMLDQAFLGKTGWIQFDEEGNRVAASYDIINKFQGNSSSSGEVAWVTVGSASGHRVSFQRSLWMANVRDQKEVLRVVVVEEEPMLMISKEDVSTFGECVLSYPCTKYKQYDNNSEQNEPIKCCCIGYLIDLLKWLEKDLPVLVEMYLVRDGVFGNYNATSKQWDGMIGDLLSNKADMALSTLTITSIRAKYVDFSYPFLHGETKLLTSVTPVSVSLHFGFLAPFDKVLWIVVLVTVNGIFATVWLLERLGRKRIIFAKKETRFSLATCMSYIWSNVVKLELEGNKPQSISARFTTAVFSFSTLIIITTYTAQLAATLVQLDGESPVTGINDPKFQDPPPGFTFTTVRGSTLSLFTISDDPAYKKIGRNMIPHAVKNYNEGLEKLKKG
ncbi:Glutamate [NMDA] receptor subunit 1 [Stylophora pistillata]|uniref:Glutamate [NMDA] receptor subunit 1 n=1 Tax=Stylophora pistillata TaxID=50429 RepID=A0A2B4SS94_STYPI|nr:Glutamate [NMDA] receptor subunit 1 [Stylophora pistillata]